MSVRGWFSFVMLLAGLVFSGCEHPLTQASVEAMLNRRFIALGFLYNSMNIKFSPGTVLSYDEATVEEEASKSPKVADSLTLANIVDLTCTMEGSIGEKMWPAGQPYHNVVEINLASTSVGVEGGFADASATMGIKTGSFSLFTLTNAKTQLIYGDQYEAGKKKRTKDCTDSIAEQVKLGLTPRYVSTLLTGDLSFAVATKSNGKTTSEVAKLLADKFGVAATVMDDSAGIVFIQLTAAPWTFKFGNHY